MKNNNFPSNNSAHKPFGFTLIEIIITISIIGILTTIVGLSLNGAQAKSRDSQRYSKANVISEYLEKYYQSNGSYPSCDELTKDPATVTNTILKGLSADTLAAPGVSSGTNSISCSTTAINVYYYNSNTTDDGRGIDGRQYVLKYVEEATGDTETIKSRYGIALLDSSTIHANATSDSQIALDWTAVDKAAEYKVQRATDHEFKNDLFEETLTGLSSVHSGLATGTKYYFRVVGQAMNASSDWSQIAEEVTIVLPPTSAAPIVAVSTPALVSTWSWNNATCAAGTVAEYRYTYTNNGGYNSGLEVPTDKHATSIPFTTAPEGYTYTVAIQALCSTAMASSTLSPAGSASYTRPITSPLAPTIAAAFSSPNVVATITPTTCGTGMTAQYAIRSRTNDGAWGSYSAWSDTILTASQAAVTGVKYGYQAQIRCHNVASDSNVSSSIEAVYSHPIAAPTAPTVAANTVGSSTTYSWLAATCSAGTTARYQYQYTVNNGYDSGLIVSSSNSVNFTTSNEGYTFTVAAQAQCYTVAVSSNWSGVGSASYMRPMTAPVAPSIAVTYSSPNVVATITPTTCALGTTAQYAIRSRTNDGAWGSYSAWSTSLTASQTASQGVKYGYQAQARCYTAVNVSNVSTGNEGIYIHPITSPAAPVVAANTVGSTTTWSWTTPACAAGSANYQYLYTNDGGFNSGWTASAPTSVAFTTSNQGYTFTVQVQSRCSTAFVNSAWSGAGSASYRRPYTYTLMTAAGSGGSVSAGGSYLENTSATITATPNTGYTFSSWSGTGCSGAASHSVTLTANMSCTANFTINYYTISVTSGGGGSVSGGGSIAYNSSATITATPSTGYSFSSWSGTGCSGAASHSFTVTAATTCTANFTINYYALTLSSGTGGSVSGGGSYSYGSIRTITATPNSGYSFSSWTGSSGCAGVASHTISVTTSLACTANFTLNITYYDLSLTNGAGGYVSGGGSYASGTSVTITATPNSGYSFSSWSGSTGCSGTASHTITMDAAKSCTANFTASSYTVSVSTIGGGFVGGGGTFTSGSSTTITAAAWTGYSFVSWSGSTGCSGIANHSVTVNSDKSCVADFTRNSYTLTVNAGTGGTVSGGGTYLYGSTPTITATPNSGYTFSSWSGSSGCSGTASHTVTITTAALSCTANFTATVVNPAVTAVSATCASSCYFYVDTYTVTATTNLSATSVTITPSAGSSAATVSSPTTTTATNKTWRATFTPTVAQGISVTAKAGTSTQTTNVTVGKPGQWWRPNTVVAGQVITTSNSPVITAGRATLAGKSYTAGRSVNGSNVTLNVNPVVSSVGRYTEVWYVTRNGVETALSGFTFTIYIIDVPWP